MPTKQQVLKACDDVLKDKIAELLSNFWVSVGGSDDKKFRERFNRNIEKYTNKFFKIVTKEEDKWILRS